MKKQIRIQGQNLKNEEDHENDNLQGYPAYPPGEDIYGKCHKDRTINPEDPSGLNATAEKYRTSTKNEKDFDEDLTGGDLDVPGSELDDDLEAIGSEDEENNYYSLGGDDHHDLDEKHED